MNKKLITSALPYVNNVPHLGNLIQVLSADVFARFCRSTGYETVYICGTDEYGTATETRALAENKKPLELCSYYHKIHKDIYDWFDISFDHFGRTSTVQQTEVVQSIFKDLDKNGFISEHTSKQLYCSCCNRFLADRYVLGGCPKCGYEDARGDQCEKCGSLLEPSDLNSPRCSLCNEMPQAKETRHLYIDLPAIQTKYQPWMEEASKKGGWSENAVQMTKAWIRDGLQQRAITRDLKWGIPVPKEGYENKVFYVWFDAPIGYISITKALSDKLAAEGKNYFDWKEWWLAGETKNVELFQFIGKDNIPFHTVIFPSSLIGTGKNWTKLYHMSSTEYLNYEDGKFSKSKGVGVFGTDAKESGIPADAWRFYIFYNRPEKSDFQFTWKDFQEKMNSELIGNLGNLVNRTLLFVNKYYEGKIPDGTKDVDLWEKVIGLEAKIKDLLEKAELKEAFRKIFEISDICNKVFQSTEPWKMRVCEPQKAKNLIYNLCYVIKDIMIMTYPYMPQYSKKVMSFFGKKIELASVGNKTEEGTLCWKDLGNLKGLCTVGQTEVYFTPMDKKTMEDFRKKFSGSQKERKGQERDLQKDEQKKLSAAEQAEYFAKNIRLKVAEIVKVERNPNSDKLYIEHLNDGSGEERVIQSGLVEYLKEEELLGKHIILVDNLKPRKMRGIESRGMLLAADYKTSDGKDAVELIEAPWAAPGTEVILEGDNEFFQKPLQIDADVFFEIEINVVNKNVEIGGKKLTALGKVISTKITENGGVN